ncbi:uncharacterized protein LOC119399125 [Rhipicephalus sanguineus]|uniref:uncharacterized protein LOC119399125 n=1 Tax=Rhipicephalus sanguineus TaxID=34632 RepID=UPI0020C37636|nr:uncharacterized protein LOC119399125 [Rhipicephalus sanguineus]
MRPDIAKDHLITPDNKLRWLTAASLATFLVLCIAITAYFIYADDAPIRVTPNVLLCATSGRGTDKLSEALDAYCTHVIYTGPLVIKRMPGTGKLFVDVKDNEGYRVFAGLTKTHERYVSFRWKAASWNEGDVLQALVTYLRFNRLRGIELVMSSHTDRAKLIRFCENFVQKMKTNASLILRVEKAVQLNKGLFKKLASLPAYLVLEAQVVNMPGLQTRRFPNAYQPFAGSHKNDVYMRYRLWQVHPWRRHLHLDNVCFTISMAVIKARKGPTRNKVLEYSYTSIKEPCEQSSMKKGVDWRALSRFRENRTIYYAYDNKQTFTNKLWRLAHEFPRYCVAAYDVEKDDFEGVCPKKSVPLLRVVRKLVTSAVRARLD